METTMDIEEYVNEDGDTVIEHITGLETLFEERSEDPCEHSEHGKRPYAHGGPGEWLVMSEHTCFAKKARHLLLCDKYVTGVMSGTLRIMCKACGERDMDPSEVYTILGRKGVDF